MSWDALQRPPVDAVTVGGVEVRRGSRVRLHPRASADVWDLALDGRDGVVESIEQDVDDGHVQLTVVVGDDPGGDLGLRRIPGHRFFFAPEEVEPLAAATTRVLVAGIGNVFLGDDGFGVALASRLARAGLPDGVTVVDYGIRGMDPVKVLAMVRSLGGEPPRTLVLGCEPLTRMSAEDGEIVAMVSEPVLAALDEAERLFESLLVELIPEEEP